MVARVDDKERTQCHRERVESLGLLSYSKGFVLFYIRFVISAGRVLSFFVVAHLVASC